MAQQPEQAIQENVFQEKDSLLLSQLFISREQLFNGTSHLFGGSEHGNIPIRFFWGEYRSGQGLGLHKHACYDEIHIVQEGNAKFTLGGQEKG
jgi:hypothetical protein